MDLIVKGEIENRNYYYSIFNSLHENFLEMLSKDKYAFVMDNNFVPITAFYVDSIPNDSSNLTALRSLTSTTYTFNSIKIVAYPNLPRHINCYSKERSATKAMEYFGLALSYVSFTTKTKGEPVEVIIGSGVIIDASTKDVLAILAVNTSKNKTISFDRVWDKTSNDVITKDLRIFINRKFVTNPLYVNIYKNFYNSYVLPAMEKGVDIMFSSKEAIEQEMFYVPKEEELATEEEFISFGEDINPYLVVPFNY